MNIRYTGFEEFSVCMYSIVISLQIHAKAYNISGPPVHKLKE